MEEQSEYIPVSRAEVDASLYRPYKRWWTAEHSPVHVLLIKREEADCIASCPSLGLRVDHPDYLEASFALSRLVRDALGISGDLPFTSTCSAPFDLRTGELQASRDMASAEHVSQTAAEPVPAAVQAKPETSVVTGNVPTKAAPEIAEPLQISDPGTAQSSINAIDEDQLDLFG